MESVKMIWIFAGLLFFAANIPLYFLPSIIGRKKPNKVAIFVLNFLLGWTIIGWFALLIWAVVSDAQPIPVAPAVARFCSGCANFSMPGSRVCRGCGKPFEADAPSMDCNAA
jgi:Superinfection immunity protein